TAELLGWGYRPESTPRRGSRVYAERWRVLLSERGDTLADAADFLGVERPEPWRLDEAHRILGDMLAPPALRGHPGGTLLLEAPVELSAALAASRGLCDLVRYHPLLAA